MTLRMVIYGDIYGDIWGYIGIYEDIYIIHGKLQRVDSVCLVSIPDGELGTHSTHVVLLTQM